MWLIHWLLDSFFLSKENTKIVGSTDRSLYPNDFGIKAMLVSLTLELLSNKRFRETEAGTELRCIDRQSQTTKPTNPNWTFLASTFSFPTHWPHCGSGHCHFSVSFQVEMSPFLLPILLLPGAQIFILSTTHVQLRQPHPVGIKSHSFTKLPSLG